MAGQARPRNLPPLPNRPSLSRRSSVAYGKTKDTRPINDKGFQVTCMRKLVQYLSTHDYGFPIPPKLLPSGKDIHNMIEFLIHQLDPSFRFTRLEDDVPLFFKTINYPFQLSKSALHAAGSPHSWPTLLAALTWLVNVLNCKELELEMKPQDDSLFDLIIQSYKYFLLGDDDSCSALENDTVAQEVEETEALKTEAGKTAEQIMELDSKLQGLKSEQSPLVAVGTTKSMLVSDVGKFNALVQNLTSHKVASEKKVDQHKQQIKSKDAALATIITEIHALSQRVSEQTVNVHDFDKMTRELQRVEEDLQSAMALKKEKEKATWDLQVLWSKEFKQLENVALYCNNAMKRLKLPIQDHSARNWSGIQLSSRAESAEELLGINTKQLLRPHITALQEDRKKNARGKWTESTDLLKENSHKEVGLRERKALISELDSKMEEFKAACQKHEESSKSIKSAIDKLRTRTVEEQEDLKTCELESTENFEKTKQETKQLEAANEQGLQQKSSELYVMMDRVTSHVEQIDARCKAVKAGVVNLKEMVGNNYIRQMKQQQL